MIRRQLQTDRVLGPEQCISRELMENPLLNISILYQWKKNEFYSIYVYNKATNRSAYLAYKKIDNQWINDFYFLS
jgi:hypothetical protein